MVELPRGQADVTAVVNVTTIANRDKINLRFISASKRLPSEYELTFDYDPRQSDDVLRTLIRPIFEQGIAVYAGQLIPGSVKVELSPPPGEDTILTAKSPWGYFLWLGGNGHWSERSSSTNAWGGLGFHRITTGTRVTVRLGTNYGYSSQPPITDSDGNEIPLNFASHSLQGMILGAVNLNDQWSSGLYVRGGHQDPEGRYLFTTRAHTGLSYDLYPADDPRGNQLSLAYIAGFQHDRYNAINDFGEFDATFLSHALMADISVRYDKQTYRLRASTATQMLHPDKRYVIDINPEMTFQIGSHIDLSLAVGVTQQQVPGTADIDPQNYEQLQRSSYSDPLRIRGNLNLYIHFDRTNGEQNNRWRLVERFGELGSL
ncbi:MAG: hypothetical protein VX834_03130 [Myxococcota bacterium]|nr:hypothetical protein [Myxococcota bacterium]